ncbi:MAG: peptide chain release factor N(5)-glutamine methyltransferase [Rikenellaceae bacterium]
MTRRELYTAMCRLAKPIYGDCEASQIARMIAEELLGWSRMDMLLSQGMDCGVDESVAQRILSEIEAGRPVQYIIGEVEFCDMRFKVREGVLIPRPESEELVRWIVDDARRSEMRGGAILDIGTGSGALAIALSRELVSYSVTALDISQEAIGMASENRDNLAPSVAIIEGDALRGVENYTSCSYDIIVSNPPYIPRSEEADMRVNVTKYEPHIALFVPDDDPLLFYRAIARSAAKLLTPNGRLYYEIHENFAAATKDMLEAEGFARVEIRVDINDKERMICAQRE